MGYRMDDWCAKASAYVKYKPDRKAVEEELLGHIEDRCEAFLAAGMLLRDAESAAVRAMGDADEVGRGLAKSHNPFFGYVLTATKVLLCIAVICVLFAAFRARERLGIYPQAGDALSWNESLFTDEYRETAGEGYSYRFTRTLYLEPSCTVESDGYKFKVARVAEWYSDFENEEAAGEEYLMYLTVKATNPLPWAGYPEAVRWFTVTDSFGNVYDNMWNSAYSYEKSFAGNPVSRTLFSYTYEMWLSYYVPGAEWIELQYFRDGRSIALRIDLTEGVQ